LAIAALTRGGGIDGAGGAWYSWGVGRKGVMAAEGGFCLLAMIETDAGFFEEHGLEVAAIQAQMLLLLIQVFLLIWIIKYTRYTRTIAEAASENLKTLHMPAVVFGILPRKPSEIFQFGWFMMNPSAYDAIVYPMGVLSIDGKATQLNDPVADNFSARNAFLVPAHTITDDTVRRPIDEEDIQFREGEKQKWRRVDGLRVVFALEAYYWGTLEVNAKPQHIGPLVFERRVSKNLYGVEEVDWVYDAEGSQEWAVTRSTAHLWWRIKAVKDAIAKAAQKS